MGPHPGAGPGPTWALLSIALGVLGPWDGAPVPIWAQGDHVSCIPAPALRSHPCREPGLGPGAGITLHAEHRTWGSGFGAVQGSLAKGTAPPRETPTSPVPSTAPPIHMRLPALPGVGIWRHLWPGFAITSPPVRVHFSVAPWAMGQRGCQSCPGDGCGCPFAAHLGCPSLPFGQAGWLSSQTQTCHLYNPQIASKLQGAGGCGGTVSKQRPCRLRSAIGARAKSTPGIEPQAGLQERLPGGQCQTGGLPADPFLGPPPTGQRSKTGPVPQADPP